MNFFSALYRLFIGPLELFFEVVYVIADKIIDNYGFSIIILSLVMNFLVLPLYRRADAMQEEQRETEKKLKHMVSHIKKTFKGDERFMMLQTYYRQNNYKPTSILKGSVSLLLEIPFFIAAYNFLSHASVFDGVAFGPLQDLGSPDGLIKLGSLTINLLPILMTAINIVSSAIYTKGLPTSSKVQLYGMAGIFLVLLYNSPSALVFYWTLNNLFSLVKNVFYKLKNPKLVLGIISSITGLILFVFTLIIPLNSSRKEFFVILLSLILQVPIIYILLSKRLKFTTKEVVLTKNDKSLFYFGVVFLALLTGIFIPSSVINSSPEEFVNTLTLSNPLVYIFNSCLISVGTFVIWFSIFYGLTDNKGKKIMGLLVCILGIIATIDFMVFGRNFGSLSPLLAYENNPKWDIKSFIINFIIIILTALLVLFIWKKKNEILKVVYAASIIGLVSISAYYCIRSNRIIKDKIAHLESITTNTATIPLSKDGKNVMIFMIDRAINGYIPYIFNERPVVAKQFDGFTYYPNTLSFGGHTNFCLSSVFGGYEYTPKELNKRDTELLKDKHNEALKVLPVMFDKNGYEVTVCDPSYAGYDWIPDLTIYNEYPDIHKYITMGNIGVPIEEFELKKEVVLNRNLFLYSIMKISPLFVQKTIYDKGDYCNLISSPIQICSDIHTATGINETFTKSYRVLQSLSKITNIKDNGNTFMMMCNDTTHSPNLLTEPEYEPNEEVNNRKYDDAHKDRFMLNGRELKMETVNQVEHYQINMAAMIQLGNYFDFLREQDLFDNTRIIIVSDHGYALNQFDDMRLGNKWDEDVMFYNPILLVKDFDSDTFSIDNQFMTNADVPTIVTTGIIENPVNPFTGKIINNVEKFNHDQFVIHSREFSTSKNNGTKFIPAPWYAVHDNIFDMNNWEYLPNHQ